MNFEFAPLKSKANQEKPQFLLIAQIHSKHWSAVITHRSQAIRLISVRRSRLEEI